MDRDNQTSRKASPRKPSTKSGASHQVSFWIGLWQHLAAYVLYSAIISAVSLILGAGLGVLATKSYENATYTRLDSSTQNVGGRFEDKLTFNGAHAQELSTPMCQFSSGSDKEIGVSVGEHRRIGDYEIDLIECDRLRNFAVIAVRRHNYLLGILGIK